MPDKRMKKGRRKQLDARRVVKPKKASARPQDLSTAEVVLSLPASMSKVKLALAQKEMVEVWQDIVAEEGAFAESAKGPKARIKDLEVEIRRAAGKAGLAGGEKIAGLMEQLAEKRAELKTLANQFKATVSGKEARAAKLQSIIQTGVEYASVPCRIERDYVHKSVRTLRLDTSKLVEERPMTDDELQMELAQAEGVFQEGPGAPPPENLDDPA